MPAPGQGIITVECRSVDTEIASLLEPLGCELAASAAAAERALAFALGAGCNVPLGAIAKTEAGQLSMQAILGLTDGSKLLRDEISGPVSQARALGLRLADKLLGQGAAVLLEESKL